MKVWCHFKYLAKLPKVGDPQFMDCDRVVVLMTRHPVFKNEFRCSKKLLNKMDCKNMHNEARGLHVECEPKNGVGSGYPSYNIIYIDHLIHGDKKLLSTIVHEVSHLVDSLLDHASVKKIDTEMRAYMIQYYTEQIFVMMNFSFSTTSLKIRQDKWGKKLDKVKAKLVKKLNLKHNGELHTIATAKQIRESGVKNVDMFFKNGPRK